MGKSCYAVSTVSAAAESKISSACVADVHLFDEVATLTAFSMVVKDLSEPSTICSGIRSSKKQIPNCSETVHYLHGASIWKLLAKHVAWVLACKFLVLLMSLHVL